MEIITLKPESTPTYIMQKRIRCNCGGKLVREGRLIRCEKCRRYISSDRQKNILKEICNYGRERDRINYLKKKGSEQGFLSLAEAGELKGKNLLWMWNHVYLFSTLNKPLRVVYDKVFINYKPRYGRKRI